MNRNIVIFILISIFVTGCSSSVDVYESENEKLMEELRLQAITIDQLETEIALLEERILELSTSEESVSTSKQVSLEDQIDLSLDMLMTELFEYTTMPVRKYNDANGDELVDKVLYDAVIDWYIMNIDKADRRLVVVGPLNYNDDKIFVEALEYRSLTDTDSSSDIATYAPIHFVMFEVKMNDDNWYVEEYMDEF